MLMKSVLLPVSFLALLSSNIISAEKQEPSDDPHRSSRVDTLTPSFRSLQDEGKDGEDKISLDRPSTPVHLINPDLPRLAFPLQSHDEEPA